MINMAEDYFTSDHEWNNDPHLPGGRDADVDEVATGFLFPPGEPGGEEGFLAPGASDLDEDDAVIEDAVEGYQIKFI